MKICVGQILVIIDKTCQGAQKGIKTNIIDVDTHSSQTKPITIITMRSFSIALLFYFVYISNCAVNNVCPTYEDYYTVRDNPKCWYDFTADSNATEIIRKHGYPLEIHRVVTPDGYILSVFRIPNYGTSIKKGPVFIQHGLLSTASNFLARGRESLAFLLADAGYDVWLGNFRGTEYSEGHVNLTVFDKSYWEHSMDELGQHDVRSQLELVAQMTGQRGNIVYIGHSLGTTVGIIYGSTFPELARKTVKLFIFLAPAGTLSHMRSPLRYLAPFATNVLSVVEKKDLIRLLSQAQPARKILATVCLESPQLMQLCVYAVNLFYGPQTQTPPNMVPVFFNQFPGGTSLRVTRHVSDLVLNNFRRYNYGLQNIEKYGSILPPIYDVSKIEVPVFIMYAVNDWACTKKDALILYKNLSPKAKIYGIREISVPDFNHIDFLIGKDAKSIVYDNVLNLIDKINRQ